MKYELIVFDLDGTILNTIDDLADSCNFVLNRHKFPTHTVEEIKYMVGNGIAKLIERACPADISKEEYETVLKDFRTYYEAHCDKKTAPYSGILECVNELKSTGVKLAVNTNKDENAALELCRKFFPGVFDFVSGGNVGLPVKPAPDGVHRIVQQLFGKNISEIKGCFVGDSDVDIATGKNCGFDVIGVDWGFRGIDFLKNHGADKVVFDCEELLSTIK